MVARAAKVDVTDSAALEAAVADRAATAPFDAGAALRRFALAGAIIDAGRA